MANQFYEMAEQCRGGQSPVLSSSPDQPGGDSESSTGGRDPMNPPAPLFITELTNHLRGYLTLCEDVLALTSRENQALSSSNEFQPFDFFQGRKALLLRLD